MKLSRLVYDPIGRPLVPLETMKPQKADWEILSLPGPVPLRFKNPDGTPMKAGDYVMLKKNNPGTPLALDYDMSSVGDSNSDETDTGDSEISETSRASSRLAKKRAVIAIHSQSRSQSQSQSNSDDENEVIPIMPPPSSRASRSKAPRNGPTSVAKRTVTSQASTGSVSCVT